MSSQEDENQVANAVGKQAHFYLIQGMCAAVCYGVSISLFYASLLVSNERRKRTSGSRKFLFALSCFMFLMATGLFASNVAYVFLTFSWVGDTVTETTPPINDRLMASQLAALPFSVSEATFEIISFLVGDAIVVWRAAVLWPSPLIRSGLCFLLLGDIATSLYDVVSFGIVVVGSSGDDATSWLKTDAARILVSVSVNFVATLCIAVQAWKFRRTLRLGFSKAKAKKSLVNNILTLMVECGIIFCAVQLFYAIYNLVIVPKANTNYALSVVEAVLGYFFPSFAAMYPFIVIVVMARQQSIFGTSTFVACSHIGTASDEADTQDLQPGRLSTLHFATTQETIGVSSYSHSLVTNVREPTDNLPVSFAPVDEKALV